MARINSWACVLLVLLRLCIGWHFFIEGLHKVHTHRIGITATNAPWTSEGFFRHGYGPLAPFAKSLLHVEIGDASDASNRLNNRVAAIDKVTIWGLTVAGAMLLLGLLSRSTCLILALFLLTVTLIAPAIPGAPSSPGNMGHFLYINQITIEMVALLALACLPTGRWFGVDILFDQLRRKSTKGI